MYQSHQRLATTALVTVCLAQLTSVAVADQFILKDGRILSGEIVSRKEIALASTDKKSPLTDEEIQIEVESDVLVTIRKSEIALNGIRAKDEKLKSYENNVSKIGNTVEDHRKMVEAASGIGLTELRNAHYWRILDLDPDNSAARAGLDHINDSGQWMRMEDSMQRRGKVRHKNKWEFPEILDSSDEDLEERRKKYKALTNITSANASQVMGKIEKVDDPLLTDVISERLVDTKGMTKGLSEQVKVFYISQIARQLTPSGVRALVICSLDPSPPVHNSAIDVLLKLDDKVARSFAIGYLTEALSSSPDNARINAAAAVLGRLEAQDAVLPLVNRLVTRHEFIKNEGTTYGDNNNGTFNFGGGGPKKEFRNLQNPEVLAALAQITGQGQLGYDRAKWMNWYASVYAKPVEDLRRDR